MVEEDDCRGFGKEDSMFGQMESWWMLPLANALLKQIADPAGMEPVPRKKARVALFGVRSLFRWGEGGRRDGVSALPKSEPARQPEVKTPEKPAIRSWRHSDWQPSGIDAYRISARPTNFISTSEASGRKILEWYHCLPAENADFSVADPPAGYDFFNGPFSA